MIVEIEDPSFGVGEALTLFKDLVRTGSHSFTRLILIRGTRILLDKRFP